MGFEEYFTKVSTLSNDSRLEDMYLWPGTPDTDTLQEQIKKAVGADDRDINNPKSRTFKIYKEMKKLLGKINAGGQPKVVDMCCGDCLVLFELKKLLSEIKAYGIDCNIDKFSTHEMCRRAGVYLIKGFLQHTLNPEVIKLTLGDQKFDFVLMLNTYRGWQYAHLREEEQVLPQWADDFFYHHAKFSFITASAAQIIALMKKGFDVKILGRGEGPAILIVITGLHKVSFIHRIENCLYIFFVQSIYYLPRRFIYYCKIILRKLRGQI